MYLIISIINCFQEIPSTGIDRWYDLDGRSTKSNVEGQIRLKLTLSTREGRGIQEEDNLTDIRQHEDLMCLFIEHEIRKYKVREHKHTLRNRKHKQNIKENTNKIEYNKTNSTQNKETLN